MIAAAAKPNVFQGVTVNNVEVSKCSVTLFSIRCQTVKILAIIKIFIKKLRAVWKVLVKVSSQVLFTMSVLKSHKSSKDRLVIPEGDALVSLELM